MANKDDYLAVYQRFFECFSKTVNPNDQLPVKLATYKLVNLEVVGGIIDWTTQYLTQKQCPPGLLAPLIKIIIDEIRKSCSKNPIDCGYNTNAEVYEPLKLMQAVMAKTNEVCLRYMDNSMLCSLPTPGPPHYVVSVAAIKNGRRKMEDRHVVIHDLNTMFNIQEASPSSYYAIFDGHAGHDAAAYSAVHLHQFLAESKHFVKNPEQALIDAFYKTDDLFVHKEEYCSGTTAVCALLKPKERMMYIAWVGDSQALIVSKGELNQCVNPHKPGRKDEKDRIEQQGGVVMFWGTWRVNGQLAVSRAIGDRQYKPYVTATPEVKEIPITANTDFIILACDGLWDFLCEDKAARIVYNTVCTNTDDIDSISQRLVEQAKIQGSTDNISVIVVFLREPSKVAADAHWANRNTTTTMEAGLDNANAANNPFANSNGAEILQQKDDFLLNQPKDDFLLNLTEGFKQNGGPSPTANNLHFTNFDMNPSNGKRQSMDEFDEDEDMGPETDVDAVDDIPSPLEPKQMLFHQDSEENQKENAFNPFSDMEEKRGFEVDIDLELQKQQSEEFEVQESMREETPTPPADKVRDATVEENVADSGEESEDEWNYFKGNSAEEPSASSLKVDQEVAELTKTIEEDEEDMSQLNPNAAEFVPISSPTRNISSPACRALMDDKVLAQSPRPAARTTDIDINVPNPLEFASEVKNRPSDIFNNSHDNENGHKLSSQEVMENLLNGKNLDEIEFYPSTPSKTAHPNPDEFHFGPNATPFSTPAKPLDQSEALSTKALFGDESTASYLDGKTLESTVLMETLSSEEKEDEETMSSLKLKDQDPMSMSFYQDETEHNPFDLNEVQKLPDNLDEFIAGDGRAPDNKENLDPESNQYLLGVSQLPKTPEPESDSEISKDMDVEKVCDLPPAISPSLDEIAKQPLPITPEPFESENQNIDDEKIEELREKDEESFEQKDLQEPLQKEDLLETQNVESFEQDIDIKNEPEEESIKESEEPDFHSSLATSNLLPPTADLLSSIENNLPTTCDIKKMPELDSAPETEELSQISDAGDEVPPLCKSPEMTSDLDQFESDIKEVIQEATQVFESAIKESIVDDLIEAPEQSNKDLQDVCELVIETKVDNVQEIPEPKENIMDEVCQITNAVIENVELLSDKKEQDLIEPEPDMVTNVITYDNIEPLEKIETELQEASKENLDNTKYSEDLFETSEEKLKEDELIESKINKDHGEDVPEAKEEELILSPEPSNEISMKDDDLEVESGVSEMKSEDKISDDLRDLDSPMEDVTTSIKDDVSASEIIEEAKDISTEKDIIQQDSFGLSNNDMVIETIQEKSSEEIQEKLIEEVQEKPVEAVQEKLIEEVCEKPIEEVCQKPIEEVCQKPIEDVCQKPIEEVCQKPIEEVHEKPIEEVQEKLVEEKIVEEIQEKPIEEVQEKVIEEIQEKLVEPVQEKLIEEVQEKPIEEVQEKLVEEKLIEEIQEKPIEEVQEKLIENLQEKIPEDLVSVPEPVEEKCPVVKEEVKEEIQECEFLDRSNVPEILSPLSPAVQPTELSQVMDDATTLDEVKETVPQEPTTELIKTDLIAPQYPEETTIVVTPAEEVKEVVPPQVEPEKEVIPPQEEIKTEPSEEKVDTAPIIAAAAVGATAAVAAATVGAAVAAKSKEKKPLDKKPSAAKKPAPTTKSIPPSTTSSKTSTTKPLTKPATTKSLSSPTKSTTPSTKAAPTKTMAAKTPTTSSPLKTASRPSSARSSSRVEASSLTTKTVEKKTSPLTNGHVKLSPKPTMASKKTTATPKTPTTPKAVPARTSPTKIEAKVEAPKSAPKPTTKPPIATKTTMVSARPRPTSLASSSVSGTTKTATTLKSTVTKTATATSPKVSSTAPPKPRPTSAPLSKPKPTASSAKPKAPDTEKQIKDTVNKQLTTTRTTVNAKTSAASHKAATTGTNTAKKTETKTTTRTTTTKTTMTKTTKKPTEVTKLANKAKPVATKASTKPQQNGTVEHVTTVVQETTTILTAEPQLVKDLSPIENNKFIIDNSQVTERNVD